MMDYTMRKPCPMCPFTRDGLRLSPARAEAIGGQIVDYDGNPGRAEFVCHKTATVDEIEGGFIAKKEGGSLHCAGALIFAEKQSAPTQMMRLCERIGMYDRTKLDKDSFDRVFNNLRELVDANEENR